MTFLRRISRRWRLFAKNDDGNASIEFVIIAPILFALVFSAFELGFLMTKSMMLDRAVFMTIRDLRLGKIDDPDHETLKAQICEYATIFQDCEESLLLDLAPISSPGTTTFLAGTMNCIDRDSEDDPTISFDAGDRSDIMLARACVIVDPISPGFGLGMYLNTDASGGYAMIATAAYMNEPD